MDWDQAIEKNREALKRILAMLVAMVEMATRSDRPGMLPRHLHRYVLRLLRPAEAATRRLIFVAARGLAITLPTTRVRKPKTKPEPEIIYVLDRVNGSIVSVPMVVPPPPRDVAAVRPAKRSPMLSFPLLDPLTRFGVRRRNVRRNAMPSIRLLGENDPLVPLFRRSEVTAPPIPQLPSADDPIDASRLRLRLEAIGRVLEDLPAQAQRMARWHARRDARLAAERAKQRDVPCTTVPASSCSSAAKPKRRYLRFSPMRPGPPPGWRRKPNHEVHQVLNDLHGLAFWVREHPGTS